MKQKGKEMRIVWLPTAVFLIMFTLAVTSLGGLSPTFDEQGFITRGLGYVRGENRQMRVGHPAGLNAYNALLLAGDNNVTLPTADPSWQAHNFHRPSELFMWEIGNDVSRILFLARLPTVWLGMLLAAVVGRWAWQMARWRGAGLLALTLIAFDPNILAHTTLATTDLGLAAAAGVAGYTLWLLLKRPFWVYVLLAGISFGLLQNTKFTAGLFVPLFAIVILIYFGFWTWEAIKQRQQPNPQSPISNLFKKVLLVALAYAVIAPLTLWASYGFQIGTLPADLPTFSQLGGLTVPLSHHLEQLLDIGGRLEKTTPAFLLGEYSDHGWWYYFPVAFLLKTPLPTLILLGLAFALRLKTYGQHRHIPHGRRRLFLDDITLLIPAFGFFAFAMTTDINLGYRHLLPTLPFLTVFTANSLAPLLRNTAAKSRYAIPALVGMLVVVALWIFPHYLSYFNLLAGGPNNGWKALVDSNIDWGQDLGNLKDWLDEHGVEQVYLSYFGEGRPAYYSIDYSGLDSWPPRLMNPEARPFYPHDPAPGIYAISATTLQGVHFDDHGRFAWFRDKEPLDKVGYSIFLYEVAPTGERVDLALGGLQLDEIAPKDFALLGSNDIVPHWFDPAQSLIVPAAGRLVALKQIDELPEWAASWEPLVARPAYTIYQVPPAQTPVNEGVMFKRGEGQIAFLGVDGLMETATLASSAQAVSSQPITLTTTWFKQSSPEPVSLFIHLIAPDSDIAAQWDGLTAPWEGWRYGDLLRQDHQLTPPEDSVAGRYELRAGLYNPQTGERWTTLAGADFILLGELTIE